MRSGQNQWQDSPHANLMRPWILVLLTIPFLVILPPRAHAQPADALQVEADTVVYDRLQQQVEATGNVRLRYRGIVLRAEHAVFDLAQEKLTARGRVRLIDAQGRELRGEVITYDVRLSRAEVQRAEAIVDRVYIRSELVQAAPGRLIARSAMATTCRPANPCYRITAEEIEVIPGEEMTARRASLWIGSVRVLTLPVLKVSLRSGEDTARSLPRFGYSTNEGVWVDYLYGYQVGPLQGGLYAKYATLLGFIPRNSLRYAPPGFAIDLTVGRNQDAQARVFDQAEVVATVPSQPPRTPGLRLGGGVGTGWFREITTGAAASRTWAQIDLAFPTAQLGERTSLAASLSYRNAWYGTGAWQATATGNVDLIQTLTPQTSFTLSYRVLDHPSGTSPFLFDTIPVADRVNQVSALFNRSGVSLGPFASTVFGGVGYSFRDTAPLVILGFSGRSAKQLTLAMTGTYNLTASELKVSMDTGVQIGPHSRLNVYASYNARTRLFEELDYTLTARLCDCFQAMLRYRQIRREIWLEIGLAPDAVIGFPEQGE